MSFNIPQPSNTVLILIYLHFIAIGLVYLITAIEATGDVTANSMISDFRLKVILYLKRVSGGV